MVAERKSERGQTIILVAFSMLALLAMAAISIDVTTLYVARNEAQQAADVAALSGAKAYVTSGYTSGFIGSTTAQTLATNAALTAGRQLSIAGRPLQAADLTIVATTTNGLNPFVSVTAARTNLPTFFSKIWGVGAIQVSATATAEAYNPSGQNAPIQLGAVKPFLVPNCLPNAASGANPNCAGNVYFINQTDGSIANGGSFIGQKIQLELPGNAAAGNALPQPSSATVTYPTTFSFFPIDIPISPPKPLCPTSALTSCNLLGKGPYFDNIACSNPTQLSCGQIVGGSTTIPVDTRVTSNTNWSQLQSRVDQGAQCLIHANNADFLQGQDIFSAPASSGQRILISPGTNNPDPSLASATYISRSDSVISVPLFDGSNLCQGANNSNQACNFTAPIVGFLQLGITRDVPGSNATVEAVILNASGCNPTATGKAVTGSSISAIPVRLIQAP